MINRIFNSIARKLSPYIYENFQQDLKTYMPLRTFDYDIANFIVFNQVEGDYLEFGAYKGDGLISFYKSIEEHWRLYEEHAQHFEHTYNESFFSSKRFIAFDSFEGLPAEAGEEVPTHFAKKGTYTVSQKAFWNNINQQLSNTENVEAVPGFFNETLNDDIKQSMQLQKASLVFIDCDLYDSAVDVFDFLSSVLTDGTVIVLDDYYRYKGKPTQGVQGAFREWQRTISNYEFNELARVAANRIAYVCSKK